MSPGFMPRRGAAAHGKVGKEDLTPMKEGRRNDRERIRAKGGGKGDAREIEREGRRGDLSMEIGLRRSRRTLLAVVPRFRESNLSCDHLRECLNELLGVGPGTTSLRELLSARHLVRECGPNRNKRRTETTAGRREREGPSRSREEARRPESTYLPVGLLLNPRSRLMDSSSAPMHAYLRHESTSTCVVPQPRSSPHPRLFHARSVSPISPPAHLCADVFLPRRCP